MKLSRQLRIPTPVGKFVRVVRRYLSLSAFPLTLTRRFVLGAPIVIVGSDILLDVHVGGGRNPKRCHPDEMSRQIIALLESTCKGEAIIEAGGSYLHCCVSPPGTEFWTALAEQPIGGQLQ